MSPPTLKTHHWPLDESDKPSYEPPLQFETSPTNSLAQRFHQMLGVRLLGS